MKITKDMLVGLLTIAALILTPIAVMAKDVMLTANVKEVVQAFTKTGKPYARIIIEEERSLNGVKYKVGVPVMAFEADQVEAAQGFKKGDVAKMIADKGEYRGRTSYTLRAFVE